MRLSETRRGVDRFLKQKASNLLHNRKARRVLLTREWVGQFRDDPGVYVFFKDDEPCYVGETSSIQDRMRDMLRTQQHVLRRHIGADRFRNVSGYTAASSRSKFPHHVEERLNHYIRERVTVKVTYTLIGRKELEEWIAGRRKGLYNKPARRGRS
jgi:hypothetical protein